MAQAKSGNYSQPFMALNARFVGQPTFLVYVHGGLERMVFRDVGVMGTGS